MTSGKPVDTLHVHFNGGAVPERVRVRERREDIGALAIALLAGFDHVPQPTLQRKATEIIEQLELPGNVRELRNLLECVQRRTMVSANVGFTAR